jgi:ATP-dependent Clp protease ATP-binding subunit ClpA
VLAVTARIPRLLARAEEVASQLPDLQIDASHLLQAICEEADSVSAQILHSLGITPQRLQAGLAALRATAHAPDTRSDWEQRVEQQLTRIEARLAKISSILVQQA